MKKRGSSLGGSFLSLASSKFIKYAFILVQGMLLARFRTLEEYGTYSQIILVANLATSIIMMGLPNSLNYFLARCSTQEEKNKFVSLYYSVNTLLSILVGVLLVLITPLLELYFKNPMLRTFLYFIALYPWTKIIISSVENLLVVFHQAPTLIFYRIANSGLMVLSILLVQFMGWTFRDYLKIFLLVETLFCVATYILAAKNAGRLHFCVDLKMLKKILIFSLPLGLATSVGTLRTEMDKLFIGNVMDTERLALYTAAAKEMPVTMISTSFTAVLLPVISRLQKDNETEQAVKLWKDVTVLSFVINTFFSIGLFVFARDAVQVLYSAKYNDSSPVFAIYSLTYIIRSTYFGMILNTGGNTKLILKSSILSLIVNAVLNVALFYLVGFTGPAVATVLSTLAGAFYLLYHTTKVTGMPYSKIFPWKDCAKILAVNAVLGVVFWGIHALIPYGSSLVKNIGAIVLAAVWGGCEVLIFRKLIMKKIHVLKKVKG